MHSERVYREASERGHDMAACALERRGASSCCCSSAFQHSMRAFEGMRRAGTRCKGTRECAYAHPYSAHSRCKGTREYRADAL